MTHNDLSGLTAARREYQEQEEAMYSWLGADPQPAGYAFRAAPRKSWWQRLMDWWRERPS